METPEQSAVALLDTLSSEMATFIENAPDQTRRPSDGTALTARTMLRHLVAEQPALQLGDVIGQGGEGVIRVATQTALRRRVAVKSLRPGPNDRQFAMELLQEAWITGALEHPNVVPIHDLAVDEAGNPLIVLKRIEGVSWDELIADPDAVRARFGQDPTEWNLDILLSVFNAVRFAHARGIVHRDLKPSNVMIGEFGEVYVLDWGIAVTTRDGDRGHLPRAADAVEMAGTPAYMAPEMFGIGEISERSDIYLLGAILYQIVTGLPPHRGDSALSLLASAVASNPPLPEDAPPGLVRILRRAMAPRPHDRFATVDEMRVQLARYRVRRGSEQLCERAERRLYELRAHLAAPGPDPAWRRRLYEIYGACRFGFRESLAQWGENPAARAGMRESTIAMVEHELASGGPRAADAMLAELGDDAPDHLRARVAAAVAAQDRGAARIAELEQLGADYDIRIGARTRAIINQVLGVCFTLVPLLLELLVGVERLAHLHLALWAGGAFGVFVALVLTARAYVWRTAVSRHMAGGVLLMLLAFVPLVLGAWALDIGIASTITLAIFLCFYTAACFALVADRQLVVMAIGFLAAFVVAAARPETALYALAAGNGVMSINAALMLRRYRAVYRDRAPAPTGLLSSWSAVRHG